MTVQVNRQNNVIHSGQKVKTVAEYLEPLFAARIPLTEIEDILKEEILEIQMKLDRATDEEEKNKYTTAINNRKVIVEGLKKYKTIDVVLKEYNEANEKLAKEYDETLKKCEELFDYIINIDVENEKDLTKLKKAIQDRVIEFSAQLIKKSNQKDALKEAFKNIENLKPRYEVIEDCTKKMSKFQAKSYDWVKEKYILSLKKIKELEEAKAKISYVHEQKQIDIIINQINKAINEDLPHVLEKPRDIERIKVEAYKELGIDIEDSLNTPPKTKKTNGEGTTSSTEDHGTHLQNEEPIQVRPIKTNDSEDFKAAKNEYLNIINLINQNLERLEELNDEQDMFTFDPEKNLENMKRNHETAESIERRINELKKRKLELEYEKYINEHIILTLDEEVKNATINKVKHGSELETFMEQHNAVIKNCYEKLQEITQQDYANDPKLQAKIETYKDIIAIQHLIITRRLVEERKNNKDFDAISFMREHRVQVTPIKVDKKVQQPQPEPEPTPIITQVIDPEEEAYKNDDQDVVYSIIKLIEEYKNDYLLLYAQLKNIESEIGFDETNREKLKETETKIQQEVTRMRQVITEKIKTSDLSLKRKRELENVLQQTTQNVNKAVDNKMDTPQHFRLIELKRDVEVLFSQAQKLINLSEISIVSEEYKKELERLNNNIIFLETRFEDLSLKITKQNVNSITLEYTVDKETKKAFMVSTKSKKAKQEVSEKTTEITRVKTTVKKSELELKNNIVDITRKEALVDTVKKIKITLLKQKLKIEYTKQLIDDLKKLKVNLEIKASAKNNTKINVTQAKDTKDKKSEYRRIDDIENLSSAQIIYRDVDTGEEVLNYEILSNADIKEELENRRKLR